MSKYFAIENGVLTYKRRYETVRIEGWGENALRVRMTENHGFIAEDWALTEEVSHDASAYVEVRPTVSGGSVRNLRFPVYFLPTHERKNTKSGKSPRLTLPQKGRNIKTQRKNISLIEHTYFQKQEKEGHLYERKKRNLRRARQMAGLRLL